MAYLKIDVKNIDKDVAYVSKKELVERTGVSEQTLWNHINRDMVDAFRFNNRTYFLSEEAERYERLVKAGLLNIK